MAKKRRPARPKPESQRAKLFWSGRSQAVRLPKEFRFPGDEVLIRRDGHRVILEPDLEDRWPDGFFEWFRDNPVDIPIAPRDRTHRRIPPL